MGARRWLVSVLAACLLCRCHPTADSAQLTHCGHPDYKEICFEESVRSQLVYGEFEPAVIRCVVRNLGKHVVAWMKNDGGDIPLTIGKRVFTPDKRVKIDHSSPDEWNLVIRGAHIQDSGDYLCQVNVDNRLMEKVFQLVVKESDPAPPPKSSTADTAGGGGGGGDDRPEGSPVRTASKGLLSDASGAISQELIKRPKTVHIYGRRLVSNGEKFVSLTCTAVFRTPDAKRNSAATVEWYHQGLRQASNASSMDVSMSWKDGDTAVSVLTLYSVRLSHTGEWVCLKRPSEAASGLETASHQLTVLERKTQQQQQQQKKPQPTHAESLGLGGGAAFAAGGGGGLLRLAGTLGAAMTSLVALGRL